MVPTIEHHRIAPRVRSERSRPPAQHGGLSAGTLLIASASSLAAALFVSRVWGAGTLAGAAVTPVVVALVAEALHRPRRAIESARRSRTAFDPLAEGRAGVREGDLEAARPVTTTPARVDHRIATRRPAGRRGLALGVATGAVAFALAAFALTGGELVLGDSAVGGGGRTTLFGGSRSSGATSDEPAKRRDASPSTTRDRGTTQPPASGDGSPGTDTAPGGGTTQPGTSTGGGTGAPTDGGSTTTTPAPATPAPSGGTTTTPASPAP